MGAIQVQVPAVLNATTVGKLRAGLDAAFACSSARVVILEGSAQCFCRGMDLAACAGWRPEEDMAAFADCLERICLGSKPVIAAVRGPATAGGVGLAAAADLVVASPEATFGLTELLFGLVPGIILPYLLGRLGAFRARLWALSAHTWTAREAQGAGLVDVIVEAAGFDRALHSWVRRLGRAHPGAVGVWKRHMAEAVPCDNSRGLDVSAARLRDGHVLERIRRFTETEELPWSPAK